MGRKESNQTKTKSANLVEKNPTGSEERAQKRLTLQFFKDGDLEN